MTLISICTVFIAFILLYSAQSSYIIEQENGQFKIEIGTGCIVAFAVVLIAVSSLRYGFIDTYAYRIMFETSRDNLEYVFSAPWGVESTWLYLLYLLNKISSDPKIMQFIVSAIVIFAFTKTIRKYSSNTALSLWIFFCLTYMSTNNGMRQYFASAICMLALPLAMERKYVFYTIIVLFASLFHVSALFCLLIILLASGKVLNKRILVLIGIGFLFMLIPEKMNDYFSFIFSDSKYVDYFESTKAGMGILRAIVTAIIPAVLALIYIRQKKLCNLEITNEETVLINILFMDAVFTIMATYMQYWARVGSYFSFASICLIPIMVRNVFNESNHKFLKFSMTVLYFVFFAYNIYCYHISGDLNNFRIDV